MFASFAWYPSESEASSLSPLHSSSWSPVSQGCAGGFGPAAMAVPTLPRGVAFGSADAAGFAGLGSPLGVI